LSELLSRAPATEFLPVDGFMTKKLQVGAQRKIDVGMVALNFYCNACKDFRTFLSGTDLYCIGVNPRQISIDCVLNCVGGCGASVAVWFLVECLDGEDTDKDRKNINNYIYAIAPNVRILRRREKLSEQVRLVGGEYAEYLDKAMRAYRDGLGAGAMIYLRKIFEQVTVQAANALAIPCENTKGGHKPFRKLLEEVDSQRHIIPNEFAADGYRLFGELSEVVHGDNDEDVALQKFAPLHRLIVGILDNIRNNNELITAIGSLGWTAKTEAQSHD